VTHMPHQLRHTFATQLLNAGCKVTTIQKLLGHRRLNSTMVYARVHDRTVAKDYYAAMAQVERSLTVDREVHSNETITTGEREQLKQLIDRLAQPCLSRGQREDLVDQMRCLLNDEPGSRHRLPGTTKAVPRATAGASNETPGQASGWSRGRWE
jgi:hypothetical protein